MRTLVVLNPAAGSAGSATALTEAVREREGWALCATTSAGEARRLVAEAIRDGYERIVAAGGDGTVNEVVQGLACEPDVARLGVIPLGTGNDLARTLGIPDDPTEAIEVVESGVERAIDLIRVETGGDVHWCINAAAGGFSGEVDRTIESGDLKRRWGPLAYLIGAIETAREMKAYLATVEVDDGPAEQIPALAIVVANGRTCAGGLQVAPDADVEDGLLDLVVIRHGTVLELTGLAARLASGTILDSPHVLHRRAHRVTIDSDPAMWFNVDGELVTQEPITFRIVPKRLRIAVGPGYHRPLCP